jgi:hypothetical protein
VRTRMQQPFYEGTIAKLRNTVPLRRLPEMHRGARRLIFVFEAPDIFALRVDTRVALTTEYEVEPIVASGFVTGGAGNRPLPNYVYRWTERKVRKVIASYDPARVPKITFFHRFRLPLCVGDIARAVASVVGFLLPGQGNQFAFAISKDGALNPWIEKRDGEVVVNPEAARNFALDSTPSTETTPVRGDGG